MHDEPYQMETSICMREGQKGSLIFLLTADLDALYDLPSTMQFLICTVLIIHPQQAISSSVLPEGKMCLPSVHLLVAITCEKITTTMLCFFPSRRTWINVESETT
jgi:hypothetical protein